MFPKSPGLDDRRSTGAGELSLIVGATSGGDDGKGEDGANLGSDARGLSWNPLSRHMSPGGCGFGNPRSRKSGCVGAGGSANEFVVGKLADGCTGGAGLGCDTGAAGGSGGAMCLERAANSGERKTFGSSISS